MGSYEGMWFESILLQMMLIFSYIFTILRRFRGARPGQGTATASATAQMSATATEIARTSADLARVADNLQGLASRFKVTWAWMSD